MKYRAQGLLEAWCAPIPDMSKFMPCMNICPTTCFEMSKALEELVSKPFKVG